MSILLVTGSRALVGDVECDRSVFSEVANVVRELRGQSVVVFGDAQGPDAWAWECVLERNLRVGFDNILYARFDLQGRITGTSRLFGDRWATPAEISTEQSRRLPLLRNTRMVAAVIREAKRAHVGVPLVDHCALHAWIANWSKTHGTEHTIRQWQQMGGPAPHVARVER